LNVFKDEAHVFLGAESIIGRLNTFGASTLFRLREGFDGPYLKLEAGAAVTNRHYIDCTGGFALGRRATLAGVKSTVLTHQIDLDASRQRVIPVTVGDECFIGSDCRILPGVDIANRVVVAMGSVVSTSLEKAGFLYAGVPATPRKLANNSGYVGRECPIVKEF
jgi:acetyltransferase-like isoleucine patch superfamily enzyme